MNAAVRSVATSAASISVDEGAAIDAAYQVLEAGKALKVAERRHAELKQSASVYHDNVVGPAMQRFHEAKKQWNKLAGAVAGQMVALELAP